MKTKIIIHLSLSALLWLCAGAANGVMDHLWYHYEQHRIQPEQYWNPKVSWKNKYRDYPEDTRAAFPFAKTALVWLTDGWHLMKHIMLLCISGAIVLLTSLLIRLHRVGAYNALFWFIVAWVITYAFGMGFHVTYSLIF